MIQEVAHVLFCYMIRALSPRPLLSFSCFAFSPLILPPFLSSLLSLLFIFSFLLFSFSPYLSFPLSPFPPSLLLFFPSSFTLLSSFFRISSFPSLRPSPRLYLCTFCYWCSFLLSLNFFFLWPSFSILLYPHLCFLLINFPSLPFLTPYCCSFLSSLPSLLCLPL